MKLRIRLRGQRSVGLEERGRFLSRALDPDASLPFFADALIPDHKADGKGHKREDADREHGGRGPCLDLLLVDGDRFVGGIRIGLGYIEIVHRAGIARCVDGLHPKVAEISGTAAYGAEIAESAADIERVLVCTRRADELEQGPVVGAEQGRGIAIQLLKADIRAGAADDVLGLCIDGEAVGGVGLYLDLLHEMRVVLRSVRKPYDVPALGIGYDNAV